MIISHGYPFIKYHWKLATLKFNNYLLSDTLMKWNWQHAQDPQNKSDLLSTEFV